MNDKVAIYVTEDPRWTPAPGVVGAYRAVWEIRRMIETGRPEELVGRTVDEVLDEALSSFRFEEILTTDFPEGGYWRTREAFREALSRANKER